MAISLDREDIVDGVKATIERTWRSLTTSIGAAYSLLGLSIVATGVAARVGGRLFALLAGVLLFGALVRLGWVIRSEHDDDADAARTLRWRVRGVLAATLVGAIVLSRLVAAVADEAEFLGFVTVLVLASSLINELRFSHWPSPRRGPIVLMVTLGVVGIALWLVPAGAANWALALIVFSFVLGHIGVVLGSEDWIDRLIEEEREQAVAVPMTIVGLVIVLASFVAIRATGLTLGYSLALVVGMLVVVATTASKGDGDLLAFVVAVTLIWAAAPRSTAPPQATLSTEDPAVLIVGDSYISGEGAERFIDGTNVRGENTCRRATTSWAVQLAERSDAIPDTVIFRACSGAQTPAIEQQVSGLEDRSISLVIVSIGGNNAGFTRLGQACLAPGDCSIVADALLDRLRFGEDKPGVERTSVEDAVADAYQVIRDAAPDAAIVAVLYPRAIELPGCPATLLGDNEHLFADAFARELNNVIRSAAAREGVTVLEPMEHALDGGLLICDEGRVRGQGINFIEASPMSGSIQDTLNPLNWLNASFHPNERGHAAMLDTALRWIDDGHLPTAPGERVEDSPTYDVPTAAELLDDKPNCRDEDTSDLDCTNAEVPSRWILRQAVLLGRSVWWRIVLLVFGAWLATVPTVVYAHRREWTTKRLFDGARSRFGSTVADDGSSGEPE